MEDETLCKGGTCPLRNRCRRYEEHLQIKGKESKRYYFLIPPNEGYRCEYLLPIAKFEESRCHPKDDRDADESEDTEV